MVDARLPDGSRVNAVLPPLSLGGSLLTIRKFARQRWDLNGLVALGISFIYSGLDIVHFAHGEIYMIGAFIGVTVLHYSGLNYPALIVVAMVLTGLVGAVIERLFYRRLTAQGGGISFAGMGIIIAGFGISMVLQNIAFLIWSAKAVPFPVNFGLPIEIGELTLPRSYDTGLVATFRDRAALEAYTVHPEHILVADLGRNISEHVASVDFVDED